MQVSVAWLVVLHIPAAIKAKCPRNGSSLALKWTQCFDVCRSQVIHDEKVTMRVQLQQWVPDSRNTRQLERESQEKSSERGGVKKGQLYPLIQEDKQKSKIRQNLIIDLKIPDPFKRPFLGRMTVIMFKANLRVSRHQKGREY